MIQFYLPLQRLVLTQSFAWRNRLPAVTRRLLRLELSPNASLTDAQAHDSQLRFFQKDRIERAITHLAFEFSRIAAESTEELTLTGTRAELSGELVQHFSRELTRFGMKFELREVSSGDIVELTPDEAREYVYERFSAGDTWSSLNALEAFPESFSNEEHARLRGVGLALQGRTVEAEALLERWRALASPVNQAWALYSLAMLAARHHSAENLSLQLAEARLNEAYSILERIHDESPDHRFYRAFNRNGFALILFRRAQVAEAATLLRECLLQIPDEIERLRLHKSVLYYNLAQCEAVLQHQAETLDAFQALVQLDPNYAENRVECAQYLNETGNPEAAIPEAQLATELDPSLPSGWAVFGNLLLQKGCTQEAVQALEVAHALQPGNPRTRLDLAEAWIGAGRYTWAEHLLTSLIPESVSTNFFLTPKVPATGLHPISVPIAEDELENAFILLAESGLRQGANADARRILEAALCAFPQFQLIRENLYHVQVQA